ncbi:gustatory receptor for sugar taste 64a-like [Culicoides brevitarsis]|uniref:gustatory receptor for sugar taste 64a-like n=1 Tax=Culicoides brevitarsis TaxID=469753 RepID=UPI00307B7895
MNLANKFRSFAILAKPNQTQISRPSRNSFHRVIFPILFVTQCFGLFPVQGISGSHTYHLRFKWLSFRTFFSFVTALIGCLMAFLEVQRLERQKVSAKNVSGVLFMLIAIMIAIIFIFVAKKWRLIMMFWEKNENIFLKAPYKQTNKLRRKISMSAMTMLLLAGVEHALAKASAVYGYEAEAVHCNDTVINRFRYYATREYHHVFTRYGYHPAVAIAFWTFSVFLTYAWSFVDFFIIMISMGIAERFSQINELMNETYQKSSSKLGAPDFWRMIRSHFNSACEILEHVDDNISSIIILSCLSNLYFICLQVLNITVKLPYMINSIYFWFSLFFLIFRTCAVFLSAAEINEQAEGPLEIIRHLPNSVWNVDIERLADQIRTQTIALSGMKFFFMTRRLLFGMIGTIITYEIVMMQNDQSSKSPYKIDCSLVYDIEA